MELLSKLFGTSDKKQAESHLRNLLLVSLADGSLDAEELSLIRNIAAESGISEVEIHAISENLAQEAFVAPSNESEAVKQISDLVRLMIADREIEDREVDLCKKLAIKLNLAPQIVDELIDFLVLEKRK
ncbi:MAG: hypothetical protein ACFCUU_01475 [Cyclobacteriaceae bacterium]